MTTEALLRSPWLTESPVLEFLKGARAGRERRRNALAAYAEKYRTLRQLAALDSSPRSDSETYEFAVIGDAEPGRTNLLRRIKNEPSPAFARQLGAIAGHPADFALQLGDMVTRATERNFLTFFQTVERSALPFPFLTVIGNHDRRFPHGTTDSVLYRSIFGKHNYAFDRGAARMVVLDSSDAKLTCRQLKWLDFVLDTPKRTLVFTHMAPVTRELLAKTHPALRFSGFTRGAEDFCRVVSRRRAERVYFGHIHGYGTLLHRGVRYVLSGGGGSPVWPVPWVRNMHHYLTVRVSPDGVRDTVHALDGRSFPVA